MYSTKIALIISYDKNILSVMDEEDGKIANIEVYFPTSISNDFISNNDVVNCMDILLLQIGKYLKTNAWEKTTVAVGTDNEREWVASSRLSVTHDFTVKMTLNGKLNEKLKPHYRRILYDNKVKQYVEAFQDNMKKLEDAFPKALKEEQEQEDNSKKNDKIAQKPTLQNGILNQTTVSPIDKAMLGKHGVPVLTLPNAKVGVDYREQLFDTSKMGPFQYEVIVSPPDAGLIYNHEDGFVSGKPTKACDVTVTIRYQLKDWKEWGFQIYVNPDPSSLWKDLPTDPNAPYQKDNSAVGALAIGGKRAIAASQRGRSHSQEGKFRDDHFLIHTLGDDDWGIIAVADGAGSAKYSREGSKIACEVVVDNIVSGITSNLTPVLDSLKGKILGEVQELKQVKDALYMLLGGAGLKALNAIKKEAEEKQLKTKDYATTLIVSVVRKIEQGWFVGAFWIGDGGVGVYRKGESVNLLGEPDGGEFAGQTRFLTSTEIWESKEIFNRVRYVVVDDFTSLVLMTDGVSDPKFETENNLKSLKHWDSFWDDLSQGVKFDPANYGADKELLKWLDFWSPGNHDDRTICILY